MITTLIFNLGEVLNVAEHAMRAPNCSRTPTSDQREGGEPPLSLA